MNLDLKIVNGRVFDGSGGDEIRADIGIRGDIIVEIGNLAEAPAGRILDAAGGLVCPGFIDAHSHSDTYLLIEPSAASKLHQGITTEICGNCGASAAPLLGDYRLPADWLEKTYSAAWRSVAEYRQRLAEVRPAVNVALLVGHNTLHAGICGYAPRGADSAELVRMVEALEQALEEGAIGLSTGLAYPPGSAVPRDELVALARVAARYGGVYTTHMRSESAGLLEAIDEAIDIAARSGVRLQLSHLKASGAANWNLLDVALAKVRAAQVRLALGADRYPYTASCTDLDILLPQWATYGGRDAILGRLRDRATRRRLRDELMQHPADYWENVMIGSTRRAAFRGRMLCEVARTLGTTEVEALLELIEADELATGGIFFSMSEANLQRVLAEPYVSIGSDASLRAPQGPLAEDHPHPRAYGSHTRFLRAALDGETVSLSEAIRKMTALPAEQFGLKRRGLLRSGYAADIAVFDPAAVRENSTYAEPHRLSAGTRWVVVNGIESLSEGGQTTGRAGRFLARGE